MSQSEESQIAAFVAENTLGEEGKKCRLQILEELEANLKKFYPNLKINLFGSSATGLAEKSSDIDVQVDCSGDIAITGYNDSLPIVHRETFKNIFERIKSLKSNSGEPVFENATFIEMEHLKIPLIGLKHAASKTSWDLSIKTPSSFRNTELIKLMISLDSRVFPLMIIVLQWATASALVGSGETQLTNFSLSLLVIVFLHQKRILPSVCQLQSWGGTTNSSASWNVPFLNDKARVLFFMAASGFKTKKSETLVQLANEFFEKFASFDPQLVVCTKTGDFLPYALFFNMHQTETPVGLPWYNMLKERTFPREPFVHHNGLTIQDPFVLNLHVKSIEGIAFTNFKGFCGKAANYLKEKTSSGSSCVFWKDFILAMSEK